MTQHRPWAKFAAVAAAIALVSGCGTEVTGSAVRAPIDPAAPVDPVLLDTANYPTEPTPLGTAGTPGIGAILEGQRMLNYVVGPWDVDPTLLKGGPLTPQVTVKASGLSLRVGPEVIDIAERHNLVNAVYTSRRAEKKTLNHTVMRFPDPAAAATAATEMADASLRADAFTERVDRLPVPGHPGALAVAAVNATESPEAPAQLVAVYTPYGNYVFHEEAIAESRDVAMQLASRMLDLQGPLIDQFRPTNPADFASIPRDPSGLLSRTLPLEDKDSPTTKGVYERAGTLHFQTDPVRAAALFDRTGLKQLAKADGNVYEAAHAAGATAIVEDFADETQAAYQPVAGVPNLPSSRCFEPRTSDQGPVQLQAGAYCLATANQYVIEAMGTQLKDVQQRVAAQYVMLTAE